MVSCNAVSKVTMLSMGSLELLLRAIEMIWVVCVLSNDTKCVSPTVPQRHTIHKKPSIVMS